ncbi:MAG: hypothetical protein H6936_08410 [Burkholderiales bacterium]|nr:hypothetical protein [Nitrosomonas sp.]MCP5274853.1 hypothetical protein [Burkholderiales bacterium]
MKTKPSIPDSYHFIGEVGEEMIVLSHSEIRIAERPNVSGVKCNTLDGEIIANAGDFIVMTSSGEQYPISASIFYGTYEVLAEVGGQFVGRRLVHERRAWPIVSSSGAEFDYGSNRGVAYVQKGGWLYQSDDDDFGLINKEVNEVSHVVVGTANEMSRKNWILRFRIGMLIISLLAPVLALLALLAFAANLSGYTQVATTLLILESILLVAGLFLTWWMKKYRWVLKAAVSSERKIANEFQVAVGALGFPESKKFSNMTLWRAAQSDELHELEPSSANISRLKKVVGETIESTESEINQYESAEQFALKIGWFTAFLILACIAIAIFTHSALFEAIAIWLPSVVGAVHAYVWRSQLTGKIAANRVFLSQLIFARKQLGSWSNDSVTSEANLVAIIRTLCRVAAVHSQTQIAFALSQNPVPPG